LLLTVLALFDYEPPAPFWTRRAVAGALAGLVCYAATLPLESAPLPVVAVVSLMRLLPVAAFAGSRRGWWLALALPYPVELLRALFLERRAVLPEDWALALSGPTAFLITMGAGLLLSLLITTATLNRAGATAVHRANGLLFALTAVAIAISYAPLSVALLRYLVEPVALATFGACAARRP
jgi:hypothetical protein